MKTARWTNGRYELVEEWSTSLQHPGHEVTHWPGDSEKRMVSATCIVCKQSAGRFFQLRGGGGSMFLLCDNHIDDERHVEVVEVDGVAARVI